MIESSFLVYLLQSHDFNGSVFSFGKCNTTCISVIEEKGSERNLQFQLYPKQRETLWKEHACLCDVLA